MRVAPWLLLVLLAGCFQAPHDPLADRGELPEDIAAPPPAPLPGDEPVFVDPPGKRSLLAGRVTDASGRPVSGIPVWIEATDLREVQDNVALYEQERDATWTVTDREGRFRFELEGGLYSVIADGDGWLPRRSEAVDLRDEPLSIDLVIVPDGIRVAAHRGASFYAPENTLAAIRKARWLGAHMVEIDVRLTADNQAILFHDPRLERTTNAGGTVDQATWAAVARLDAGSWFESSFAGTPVPTLRQGLDAVRGLGVEAIIDIKASPERAVVTRETVAAEVKAMSMQSKVVLAAFRKATVSYCVDQGLRCAYISNGTVDGPGSLAIARELGAHYLLLNQTSVTPGLAKDAEAMAIRLFAWTANELDEWDNLLSLGVHGIITDRPAFLVDLLGDRALQAP